MGLTAFNRARRQRAADSRPAGPAVLSGQGGPAEGLGNLGDLYFDAQAKSWLQKTEGGWVPAAEPDTSEAANSAIAMAPGDRAPQDGGLDAEDAQGAGAGGKDADPARGEGKPKPKPKP
jgi:hypothetical protein